MRRDDGAGPAIVAQLAEMSRESFACRFAVAQQLAPELAADLVDLRRVIFIDASIGIAPGKIRISRLAPRNAGGAVTHCLTHHVAPDTLLGVCRMLWGRGPQAWSIEIGAGDLSVGDQLSPRVAEASARLVRHLAHCLERWSLHAEYSAQRRASKEVAHVCP
jgi:hydrogenase maturation protease